jgi:hypothetical protein
MVVWMEDPSVPPATSGPPDDEVVDDLVKKIKPLRGKGGRGNKDHQVKQTEVISTESTTTPPP